MTSERRMSYEPVVGDKVIFLCWTKDEEATAEEGEIGEVTFVSGSDFQVRLHEYQDCIRMNTGASTRIPHDLMRIDVVERVPTPCENNVDVDSVIQSRKLEDIPGCHDVEIKALTLHQMCQEIRKFRIEEKNRIERSLRMSREA